MAAVRSFDAEDVFCEQMVERAQASSFRNRWDRDRLWFWQQRERAARAATPAKVSTNQKNAEPDEPLPSVFDREAVSFRKGGDVVRDADGNEIEVRAYPVVPAAPLAALPIPDPPAPTLFDTEEAA